jgi:hypothetical protein
MSLPSSNHSTPPPKKNAIKIAAQEIIFGRTVKLGDADI